MELKFVERMTKEDDKERFNRTFMELKLRMLQAKA